MNKKLIISLSITFSIIAVVLILFWTLFGLSVVSVEYHSTRKNLVDVSDDEIVSAGQFNLGACVLFEGKNKSIQNINNFVSQNKNFAYLKILNIETVFPNKFVIHVMEREELFAVENDGQVYVCDRDFRVLRITDSCESAIKLKGLDIENKDINEGDFLNIKQKFMLNFFSVMLQNNRDLAEQLGKFSEINITPYKQEINQNEYYSMRILTKQGRTFIVNNPDFAFLNKIQKMFAIESALYGQNFDEAGNILDKNGNVIYVTKNVSGEYVECSDSEPDKIQLSLSLLSHCAIKIDNLILDEHINRSENDIYYSFLEL